MSINELSNWFLISSLVRHFILVALAAPSFCSFGRGRSLGGCCICVALIIALGVVFGGGFGLTRGSFAGRSTPLQLFLRGFFQISLTSGISCDFSKMLIFKSKSHVKNTLVLCVLLILTLLFTYGEKKN